MSDFGATEDAATGREAPPRTCHDLPMVLLVGCRSLLDLQGLEVGVEVERVVAALAADAGDADAAERRRQVADQERVRPDRARPHQAPDPVRALLARRVDDPGQAVAGRVRERDRFSSDGRWPS